MDFAHPEEPLAILFDQLIFVTSGERRDDAGFELAQHNNIAVGAGLGAIDADQMIHRAMLPSGSLTGARHMRGDKIVDRFATAELTERTRFKKAICGKETC